MLVLSRKNLESVVMGGGGGLDRLLKITVLEITGCKVKLGFDVDSDIPVHRQEIWDRMHAKGEFGLGPAGPLSPWVRSK
jgi:carbon storage regulator CsrA